MSADPIFLVVGPSDHGVVILAEQLVGPGSGSAEAMPIVVRAQTAAQLIAKVEASPPSRPRTAHIHFTDQLFGADCRAAAAAYERLAVAVNATAAGLSVTLHDLPMTSDAADRYRRRSAAYARVIAATNGPVIVSSEHEARLARAISPAVRPVVIPLPIEPASDGGGEAGAIRGTTDTDVAILGYVYPGKGHAEALEALAELPIGMGLAALGRVADGHAELADELRRRARTLGRRLTVAGWIADRDLAPRLRAAAIPLVGHRQLSASASIGSWLAAGRRPLVPDVAYTREVETRNPGSVRRYRPTPAGLRSALARAHADPRSTWLPPDIALTPSRPAVAAAYRRTLLAVPTSHGRSHRQNRVT